jgi:predicted DNA-binding transcriptional regulator AlpA
VKILSLKEVTQSTGLSRTTIWRMQKAKKFPQQVQLSERRVGIPENEIVEWVNLRKNVDGSQHFPSTP